MLEGIESFDWPNLMCGYCRDRLAEVLWDNDPACIRCADMLLDRMVAVGNSPGLREQLPELDFLR